MKKKPWIRVFSSLMVCLFLATMLSACVPDKLSRQDAIDVLLEQAIKPEEVTWEMVAFSYPELLKPGDTVVPGYTPDNLHETTAEEWFFWIDDNHVLNANKSFH